MKKNNIGCTAFIILLFVILGGIYSHYYEPEKKQFKSQSKRAFLILQEQVSQIYLERNYIYDETGVEEDIICEKFLRNNFRDGGNCLPVNGEEMVKNFTIKGTKIDVYGMETLPYKINNSVVKDFMIDINGEKEPNKIGMDRLPLRIYSTGRLGGNVVPVNCSVEDQKHYGFRMSKFCGDVEDLDFVTENYPLGFSVIQIGSKDGKSQELLRGVPYARADCSAFAGESMDSDDYCSENKVPWFSKCYVDYTCSIKLTK